MGGGPTSVPFDGAVAGGGHPQGLDGVDLPLSSPPTKWHVGSVVEVAWGISANHGGGYSYRLCKLPDAGVGYLTEECFQETPLDFVGELQWVQYGQDEESRVAFVANRNTEGTYPKGSQWTKNPIPACYSPNGGILNPECDELQFPEPLP